MDYKFTEIKAHNLVADGLEDTRYVAVASGFDGHVLVITEDAYGEYGVERMSVRKFEQRFQLSLTKENG